jgi:CubicO group peptidase (beta-lactamase class C family)
MVVRTHIFLIALPLLAPHQISAQQLDPAALQAAARYSGSHGGTSFLVIQSGKTLLEEYPVDRNPGIARRIYSGTKAFWGLAALAAAEDGLIKLDERVADTIPAWQNDPRKSRITIRQLLDFSCGLAPGFSLHNRDPGDRDAIAIRLPVVTEPETAFIYGPSALQVFHYVLKNKLHGQTPQTYLERRVLRRLGLGSQRYLLDRAGNPLLAAGWQLTARQWAKLGQVVLKGGAPIVSASSLEQCWHGSAPNPAFAFGWWNNRAAPGGHEFDFEKMLNGQWSNQTWREACLCRDAPNDLVACIGSGYQRLFVIPSLKLIIVRHGRGGPFSDARFLRLILGRE